MRFAIGQAGGYIDAHKLSRSQIEQFAPFSCPHCGELVILKRGVRRRDHFAHVRTCGRGESTIHQLDKWGVRQWLQDKGYHVDQEINIGGRRADLVATVDASRVIFEIQRSPLGIEVYKERTAHYIKHGYEVVWLASELSPNGLPSLSPWMRQEIARLHMLIIPFNNRLYRFVGFPVSIRRGLGEWVEVTSIQASPYEPFYRFDAKRWTHYIKRKRMRPSYLTQTRKRLILTRLYAFGLSESLLPSGCYLPMPVLWGEYVHPFDFQIMLYLNRRESPKDSIKWSIEKTCRQLQLTPSGDFVSSFQVQWRQLLNVYNLSENVSTWRVPSTLEQVFERDVRMFQGFQRFMAKSYIN